MLVLVKFKHIGHHLETAYLLIITLISSSRNGIFAYQVNKTDESIHMLSSSCTLDGLYKGKLCTKMATILSLLIH